MKRWVRPGFLLAFLLCSLSIFANRVEVKGTVKFSNGVTAPNFPILLQTDTIQTNTGCYVNKPVISGTNGAYSGVLECANTFTKVFITYKDCNGNYVRIVKEAPATAIIEYNIVLCTPAGCKAVYTFTGNSANPGNILFNSSSSTAGGPYPDEIISRTWSWADGSAPTDGNVISPNHVFPKDSIYNVCLRIATRNGCVSYSCQKITVVSTTGCVAYFLIEQTNNRNEWRFLDTSYAVTGDEIISRRWTWGDGSPALEGNIKYPTHVFPGPGTYEVCLQIHTRLGCEKSICKTITIQPEPCKAYFTMELLPVSSTNPATSFRFNSSASFTGNPPTTIISQRWDFGDDTILEGNIYNPVHTYKTPGTYKVCLVIKTANNCVSDICKNVVVLPAVCRALFKWELIPGETTNPPKSFIAFYGGGSHSSNTTATIIGRRWTFGDGSSLESLDSTVRHGYTNAGTYTVCLYIKTSDGCYDSVCNTVIVPNPPTSPCVPGFNWLADKLSVHFNSAISTIATGDKIIKRIWSFGDGTTADGNLADPVHQYTHAGIYEVCLAITTDKGCQQKICKQVTITTCEAVFRWESIPGSTPPLFYFKFFSGASHGWSNNYSVIGRRWTFGDGTVLETTDSNVVHKYTSPGQYLVCLTIKTSDGCYDSTCKTLVIANTAVVPVCKASFGWTSEGLKAKFISAYSTVAPGDSIIKRTWIFGDGSKEDGNHIYTDHAYPHDGQYEVCLVIETKGGCENRVCQTIVLTGIQARCYPLFKFENIAPRKLSFNSTPSYSQISGDIIVKRIWSFGDGTSLSGNVVSPSHEYRMPGGYTVCLRIVTAAGCESTWCQQVKVNGQQTADSAEIKLIKLYPNPASTNTLAFIWSKHNNVPATLAIYDIYGAQKWSIQTVLPQGNSTWQVYVGNLAAGPYIFKVITQYGIQYRQFFKVN